MVYWRPESIASQAKYLKLDVVASSQLHLVEPWDTLWVVTIKEDGRLTLGGRLQVGELTDFDGARRLLGTSALWKARYYAIAFPGTAENVCEIDLMDIADRLRFEGANIEKLTIENGMCNVREMKAVRALNEESANLLNLKWSHKLIHEQTILECRLEGKVKAVLGKREGSEWRFRQTQFNGEVEGGELVLPEITQYVDSFEKCIQSLGTDWIHAAPTSIHPEFREIISEAVRKQVKKIDTDERDSWERNSKLYWDIMSSTQEMVNEPDQFQRDLLIEDLKYFIRSNPTDAGALYNLGIAYDSKKCYREAVIAYHLSLKSDPDNAYCHYNLGMVFSELGQVREALSEFEDAVRLKPDFSDAYFMLGCTLGDLGKHTDSIKITKIGLKFNPDESRAHYNIGLAYMYEKEFDKALKWFNKTIKLSPSASYAHFQIGRTYHLLGKHELEFNAYLKALEYDPEMASGFKPLAQAYLELFGRKVDTRGTKSILEKEQTLYFLGMGFLIMGEPEMAYMFEDLLRTRRSPLAKELKHSISRFNSESLIRDNDQEKFVEEYKFQGNPEIGDPLCWLDPYKNPFKRLVLDVRPFTYNHSSKTHDHIQARFQELRSNCGDNLSEKSVELPSHVDCDLVYHMDNPLKDGALFTASQLEDKWDIFLCDNSLYFCRSWTGELIYKATIDRENGLRITSIRSAIKGTNGDQIFPIRAVDFIIRSHLLKQRVPHPIPHTMENNPEKIARFSFSLFGRWAGWASYEDTTKLVGM
jgi:tetratricopeptide (TPR) repeat protein